MKFTKILIGTFCLYFKCNTIAIAQLNPNNLNPDISSEIGNSNFLSQTPTPEIPPQILEPIPPSLPPIIPTPQDTPLPQINPETPEDIPSIPNRNLDVKIRVEKIEVLGSTVFETEELEAAVAPFVGRDLSFEELLSIRTAITNLYLENGFSTSGAFLPPQDVTDGVIQIQVVEGQLERIDVEGTGRLNDDYVRSRLEIAAGPPVNITRLQEALQLLQLNPLIDNIQAELSAGTAPGFSILSVNVIRADALDVTLSTQNIDSPSIGEFGGSFDFTHQNVSGLGDSLNTQFRGTDGLDRIDLSYSLPVNASDGTMNISYRRSESDIVQEPFSVFDISSVTNDFSIGFRQPIIRKPNTEFAIDISFNLIEGQTLLAGEPFSFSLGPEEGESRLSIIRFSQEWVNRGSTRVLAARSQLNVGIDTFNATTNESEIDGIFTSWQGQFQLVQSLGGGILLIARTGAQLTPDTILPLEQFTIGGLNTVRGYINNQRIADNGVIGSVEMRFPLIRDNDTIGTLEIAPFFDIGTVWNRESARPDILNPTTLASVGLGLRWEITPFWFARIDYGLQLNEIDDVGTGGLQDDGIYFTVNFTPF